MVSLPEKISVESERGSGVLQGNFKQPYTFAEMVAEYALPSFPYGSQSKERLAKGMGIELE